MRKLTFPLLLLLSGLSIQAQTHEIVVQLAAFDREVPLDYFTGLENVFHIADHNDIHRYYIGGLSSQEEAKKMATKTKGMGYNSFVVDLEEQKNRCSSSCRGSNFYPIRSIFFDFDKASLRKESYLELDKLVRTLINNPDYEVELTAHTDAFGTNAYNNFLSQKRAYKAQQYLLSLGISEKRIKISPLGETHPIAKNRMNDGQDAPAGRQLNRRVEFKVFDSKGDLLGAIVEQIEIPDDLRI